MISENFNTTNQIDIFDGGPTLACITQNIRTIKQSRKIRLESLTKTIANKNYLVCNHSLKNFTVMKITKQTPLDIIKNNKLEEAHIITDKNEQKSQEIILEPNPLLPFLKFIPKPCFFLILLRKF